MTAFSMPRRQAGVSLPVMLIMMLVLLVTSIYLLRSSNSTTMAASNLAYDAALSRAVDVGLHAGFQFLRENSGVKLNADIAAAGYRASFNPASTPRDAAFWAGSVEVVDADNKRIRYVIHRMCSAGGAWSAQNNNCTNTPVAAAQSGSTVQLGDSLASDAPTFTGSVRIHYLITARMDGARGGNVINQMVVLVGA